jgi:hypothetical protein
VFDLPKVFSISLVVSDSHVCTLPYLSRSVSAIDSRNQGRAGLVMPAIMPAARMRSALVPVLS